MYVLLPGMSYTWRIRTSAATTAIGENDPSWRLWSEWATFFTPEVRSEGVSPVTPSVGATLPAGPANLQWQHPAPHLFYWEVQVSPDPAFNTDPNSATAFVWWMLIHGGVSVPTNSWTTPPLEAGRYYWRVRPRVQGNGRPVDWGPTWSFEVR